MVDSYGRKIDYLRISLTDKCNLRCLFCMGEDGVDTLSHSEILRNEEFYEIAKAFRELGIEKIRFTGGEPLLRKGAVEIIKSICSLGFKRVGLTTNGTKLKELAKIIRESGVSELNISLPSVNEEIYRFITRGGELFEALSGIEEAQKQGFKSIKINTVLLKGINDNDIKNIAVFCKERGLKFRVIELMPFSNQADFAKSGFMPQSELIEKYALKPADEVKEDLSGKNYNSYIFPTGERIDIIAPLSRKFCGYCNRVRLTADGKILNCLHGGGQFDIKEVLRSGGDIKEFILSVVSKKPLKHHIENDMIQSRPMKKIGG
ncbi:MAG: GTP 3',8-cyclase MoaA [Clostridiales bacterium]|nr:GTP 3',8-cyclase MoaA [Clostridiales bacterium]